MPNSLADCADSLEQLRNHIEALGEQLEGLGLPPPVGDEWHELLVRKLLPQLDTDTPLIVAVVGGTNTGKSVVFNHVAGEAVSATSPLASGTRHPLCLVPEGFDTDRLRTMFDGFTIIPWSEPEQTLEDVPEHQLFWRTCPSLPDNLLVLDSPDIDSDAQVNWERAEWLRRSADVLIAVLTQQKYNDAAVKQFFRRAAAEDLATIVVFNQCQFPDDEQYWPAWLETFVSETGTSPEFVYLVGYDRSSAESGHLEFLGRLVPDPEQPRDLQQDLSSLRYETIKFRSLRGSLGRLLAPESGVGAWLETVRGRSDEFHRAAELLSAEHLASIDDWPSVPARPLINSVRSWWRDQRSGWSAGVHSFYNTIGHGLAWPFRKLAGAGTDTPQDPLAEYREIEWSSMLGSLEQVYRRLAWCRDAGGAQLGPRLSPLLEGESRQAVLEQLRTAHQECELNDELSQMVAEALEEFRSESPRSFRLLKRIDKLAAVARPVTSVALFMVGFGPVGEVAAGAVSDAAMQSALHVAGDVAGGTVAATLGESAISQSAATGAGYIESKFRNLQDRFAVRRAGWLATQLEQLVLGDLARELEFAAATPRCDAFQGLESTVGSLAAMLEELAPLSVPPSNSTPSAASSKAP